MAFMYSQTARYSPHPKLLALPERIIKIPLALGFVRSENLLFLDDCGLEMKLTVGN